MFLVRTLHVLDLLFIYVFSGQLTTSCNDAIELDQLLCEDKKKDKDLKSRAQFSSPQVPKSIISLCTPL